MLVEGKPGYNPAGKGVYRNFQRDVHMSSSTSNWKQEIDLYTGKELRERSYSWVGTTRERLPLAW